MAIHFGASGSPRHRTSSAPFLLPALLLSALAGCSSDPTTTGGAGGGGDGGAGPGGSAGATLGYVATAPGADRIPVYALGDPAPDSDNADCYYMRWPESRVKHYTTSDSERTMLLSQRWRDDGIAFYVAKAGAIKVYEGE